MTDRMQTQKIDDEELILLMKTVLETGGVFPLVVTGNSMVPMVRNERDKVFLVSPKKRVPCVGDVVFAWCDKEKYVLHRIVRCLDEERFLLRGDGNQETEIIRKTDIVAVADSFCRKGRTIRCDSWRYRCYVWCWMHLWRLRPCFFRLHSIWYQWIKGR